MWSRLGYGGAAETLRRNVVGARGRGGHGDNGLRLGSALWFALCSKPTNTRTSHASRIQ